MSNKNRNNHGNSNRNNNNHGNGKQDCKHDNFDKNHCLQTGANGLVEHGDYRGKTHIQALSEHWTFVNSAQGLAYYQGIVDNPSHAHPRLLAYATKIANGDLSDVKNPTAPSGQGANANGSANAVLSISKNSNSNVAKTSGISKTPGLFDSPLSSEEQQRAWSQVIINAALRNNQARRENPPNSLLETIGSYVMPILALVAGALVVFSTYRLIEAFEGVNPGIFCAIVVAMALIYFNSKDFQQTAWLYLVMMTIVEMANYIFRED